MNYARLSLLQALHCGGPAIMRDLGTQLGATPRNMTAMVDTLEQAQLVVRRPHPNDRRATMIELSPAGARAADGIGPRLTRCQRSSPGFRLWSGSNSPPP